MPSRKIPKNYSNITGKIYSSKATRMLSYESKLERDFYFLFDFDSRIEKIYDQPITIEYTFGGKIRKYTPDVLLNVKGYPSKILGEVKYYDELRNNFSELRPKFEAAIEFCKQNSNMEFQLFTNRCAAISSEVHRKNISFLRSNYTADPKYKCLIEKTYEPLDTIGALLNKITRNKFEQMEIVPTLWAMIRYHALEVDLYKELSFNTELERLHTCVIPEKSKREIL